MGNFKMRSNDILDDTFHKVATIRGNGILNERFQRVATGRDPDIYDGKSIRIACLADAKKTIDQAMGA